MFYSKESFAKELFDMRHEYRKDNAWVIIKRTHSLTDWEITGNLKL